MTLALARPPLARLMRTRRGWIPVLAFSALAVAAAWTTRASGDTSGADRVLTGSFGVIVLPLLAYSLVGAALGGAGLARGVRGVVALGGSPRGAALAATAVAALASALAGGALALLVCALSHGPADPPLAGDLLTSFWVSALGGAAYAAYFAAGSAIGRGAMRAVFLVVDWVVGAGAGAVAALTPRGHVMSLLGGPLCADLSQRVSSVVLAALFVLYAAIAVALVRRAR